MSGADSRGEYRCTGQGRAPYKTSQVGPFCLADSFLWLQQECGLQNLAPVAWHLVKLIRRQETNCQISGSGSSLPLPSRLWMGRHETSPSSSPLFSLFFPATVLPCPGGFRSDVPRQRRTTAHQYLRNVASLNMEGCFHNKLTPYPAKALRYHPGNKIRLPLPNLHFKNRGR